MNPYVTQRQPSSAGGAAKDSSRVSGAKRRQPKGDPCYDVVGVVAPVILLVAVFMLGKE